VRRELPTFLTQPALPSITLEHEFLFYRLACKRIAGVTHCAPDGGRRYNEVANIR
jgi:hypothetical protein